MIIRKVENSNNTMDIILKDDTNTLSICVDDNGDLLWKINRSSGNKDEENVESFIISNEDEKIYNAFEKMYYEVNNIIIHKNDCPPYVKTIGDLKKYQKNKLLFLKYNLSNYQELFSQKERLITWFSDGCKHELANILTIKKFDDSYQIDFRIPTNTLESKNDNDKEIIVRMSRSRSRYFELNTIFIRLFNELKQIDDIQKEGHQYTIWEYIQPRR